MSEYIVDRENVWPYGSQREEIVRCRDCVHGIKADLSGNWYECMKPDGNGDYARYEVESNGYCAWGEKKEKEAVEVWQPASEYDVTCYETGDCDE